MPPAELSKMKSTRTGKVLALVIIGELGFGFHIALAECLGESPENLMSQSSLGVIGKAQILNNDVIAKDIAGFCRFSNETNDFSQLNLKAGDYDALLSTPRSAWTASEFPNANARMAVFEKYSFLLNINNLNSLESLDDYLDRQKSKDKDDGYEDLNRLSENGNSPQDAKIEDLSGNHVAMFAVCNQLVFGMDCPKALQEGIELERPKIGDIAYPSLYKDVLGDPAYNEGLRLAALKIVKYAKEGKIEGQANLFEDVRNSFREAGVSPTSADDMAWKIMGLIATGGPNIDVRLFPLKADKDKKIALTTIAQLAPILDSMTFGSGHPYSYPKTITTHCDSGKTYHFWMSAYLARELKRRGHGPISSAAAAFSAEKGYQMLDSSADSRRSPERPFQEELFSPYSNTIRMDLAYASTGALYGAMAAEHRLPELDVDNGLRQIIHQSQPIAKLSAEESKKLVEKSGAGLYFRWKYIMGPDAAFEYFITKKIDSIPDNTN